MGDFQNARAQRQSMEDMNSLSLWRGISYIDGAGAELSIEGEATLDDNVPLMNFGYGFNAGANPNVEVLTINPNADQNQMVAMATIPRDKQHQWDEGASGIQSFADGERRIEFMPDGGLHLREGTVYLGEDRELSITVNNGSVTIQASATINFSCPSLKHNGVNIGSTHKHSTPVGISGGPQ